jgi:ribonuclease-3
MEALIGATYISNGLEPARQFVVGLIEPLLADAAVLGAGTDWKTHIQELAASRQLGPIHYAVVGDGPDHARTYTATLLIGGTEYGTGTGNSKKEAEQQSAANAWKVLGTDSAASAQA